MTPKDDIELRKAALLKAARSLIRLKHSIAADEELNSALPELERAFNSAVQTGEVPSVGALLSEAGLVE